LSASIDSIECSTFCIAFVNLHRLGILERRLWKRERECYDVLDSQIGIFSWRGAGTCCGLEENTVRSLVTHIPSFPFSYPMPSTPESEVLPPGAPLSPGTRRERLLRIGSSATVGTVRQGPSSPTQPNHHTETEEAVGGDTFDVLSSSMLSEHTSLTVQGPNSRSYGTLPRRRPSKKGSQASEGRRGRDSNPVFSIFNRVQSTARSITGEQTSARNTIRDFAFGRLNTARPISAYDAVNGGEEGDGGDAKINGIRVWYSSFTSIDWLHDAIKDSLRFSRLRKRKSIRARFRLAFDKSLGWIIVTIVGFLSAVVAFLVVRSEQLLFDFKEGYCEEAWYKSKRFCCPASQRGRVVSPYASEELCEAWRTWSEVLSTSPGIEAGLVEYATYTCIAVCRLVCLHFSLFI